MKTLNEAMTHWLADQSDDDLRSEVAIPDEENFIADLCAAELARRQSLAQSTIIDLPGHQT